MRYRHSVQMPGYALQKQSDQDLWLLDPLRLGIIWRVDRVRPEARGEGVSYAGAPHAASSPTRARSKVPRLRRRLHIRPGERIEGRISVLFRGRGMKRCRAKGRERFEMLVGAAVLANNLMRIAQLIEDKKPNRRRATA